MDARDIERERIKKLRSKSKTAPEVPVQKQLVEKECPHCTGISSVDLMPGEVPKYCTQCGKEMDYFSSK